MRLFVAILFTAVFIGTVVWHINLWYDFNHDIGNWLKLAGDAPNIERANEFLAKAISGMEKHGKTQGSSAYFFDNPNADLSIWYSQVTGAKQTLESILERSVDDPASSISQLERDNALMKIREVLLDEGESGTKITTPPHICVYPHQWKILFLYIFSFIFATIAWCVYGFNRY